MTSTSPSGFAPRLRIGGDALTSRGRAVLPTILRMAILIALLTAGSAGARAQGEEDPSDDDLRLARSMERVFLRVAETTLPSVVQILVRYGEGAARPAGSGRRERGLRVQGSGFFVGADGLILTNAHVVQGADALAVRLHDGREHDADVVGIRESVDLALLRISVPGTPLTWGDGARLRPGSIVFSVGSPYGNRSSVSQGIVSGIGRAGPQGGDDVTYIQTDAAINAGNSGGPLLDLEGMVVGVNTWIYAPSGLSRGVGFALPGDLAREVTATLLAQARSPVLARSDRDPVWMGILPAAPDDEGLGLALSHVFAASPAARAGIRTGDRLMRIEGSVVSSRAVIDAVLDARVPGDTVRVELAGGGSRMLAVTLRPQHLPGSTGDDALPPPAHAPEDATEVTDGVLRGRSCTGGCGYDVLSCFGCSAALADRALAHDLARRGLDQGEIRRRLSPAVTVTVWADYTDPEGRAALRLADRLQARFGSLVRVVRRHYPENAHLPPDRWRDTINALELARAHGRYEDAHTWLVTDSGLTWIERLEQMPRRLGIDDEEFWLGIHENRHRAVIRHDLAVAPSEFAVTNQPTLDVNGTLFRGPFTADELATYVGRAVIASAR